MLSVPAAREAPKRQLKRVKPPAGTEKVSDLWQTDPKLFEKLHAEFGFDVDLAANEQNRLVGLWYGPGSLRPNALDGAPWGGYQRIPKSGSSLHARVGYFNCPYSDVTPWVETAVREARQGFTSVGLIPLTPDVKWWAHVEQATEVRRIPHRVPYVTPKRLARVKADRDCVCNLHPVTLAEPPCDACGSTVAWVRESSTTPMFPSCVAVFRPQPGVVGRYPPRYVTWDYR